MVNGNKYKSVLPLLLMFLGYCGGDKNAESDNWLTTSDLQNLVAPAGITASCQATGRIKVEWNASYDTIATHLQIFRKAIATEDEFVKIDEVDVEAGIYSNVVTNNAYYRYQVKAIVRDDEGNIQYLSPDFSPQTAQVRSTTNCVLPTLPGTGNPVEPDGD